MTTAKLRKSSDIEAKLKNVKVQQPQAAKNRAEELQELEKKFETAKKAVADGFDDLEKRLARELEELEQREMTSSQQKDARLEELQVAVEKLDEKDRGLEGAAAGADATTMP